MRGGVRVNQLYPFYLNSIIYPILYSLYLVLVNYSTSLCVFSSEHRVDDSIDDRCLFVLVYRQFFDT